MSERYQILTRRDVTFATWPATISATILIFNNSRQLFHHSLTQAAKNIVNV